MVRIVIDRLLRAASLLLGVLAMALGMAVFAPGNVCTGVSLVDTLRGGACLPAGRCGTTELTIRKLGAESR